MKRKSMKKAGAAVLSMALLLSMGAMATPASAAAGDALTVRMPQIICDGAAVKLASMDVYQVAKRDSATGAWAWNAPFTVNTKPEMLEELNSSDLNELARSFRAVAASAENCKVSPRAAVLQDGYYQVTLVSNNSGTNVDGVGYYLIVPHPEDNDNVFQPVLVEIDSADDAYTTVRAKANPIPLHKYITATTQGETARTDGKSKTSTATVNDIVSYSVESVLPEYLYDPMLGDRVKSYVLTDDPSDGIALKFDTVVVKINNETVYDKNTTSADVAVAQEGDGFTVTVSGERLLDCMGQDIKVTFDAAIDKNDAVWGAGYCGEDIHTDANGTVLTGNPNTVMLTWGNNYVTGGYVDPQNPDAPEDPENPYEPDEPMKKDSVTTYVGNLSIGKLQNTEKGLAALPGAAFKLTKAGDTAFSKTATSDGDGKIDFGYLPAGTYTLEETGAPSGFKIFGAAYTFTIKTKDDTSNSVDFTTYEITPQAASAENVTFDYVPTTNNAAAVIAITDPPADTLPATGGIGTYVFTFGGAAIILLAGVLFVLYMKKRKAED